MSDADEMAAADELPAQESDTETDAAAGLDVALREALGTGEPSVPDPQPVAAVVPDSADAALVEAVGGGLTWIPFACYLGAWVVLVGLSAYLLYGADTETPARWMPEYVPLVWSGVGLTALGPVLSVIVWAFARSAGSREARRGLFAAAMARGALVAFFGVALWIATLFVLELVATGGAL